MSDNGAVETEMQAQKLRKAMYMKIALIVGIIVFGVVSGIIGYFIGQADSNSNNSNNSSSSTEDNCNYNDTDADDDFEYVIYDYFTDTIDYSRFGQWETVVPTQDSPSFGPNLGMQAVHTVLLPSRKILMVNGGSNRQSGENAETYPHKEWPKAAYNLNSYKFFDAINWTNETRFYQMVNNNGFYNTITNEFYRIPHPLVNIPYPQDSWGNDSANEWFYPNDLFCAGQLHVRDGNVLFTGGTEWYGPEFTGPTTTYLFNWTYAELVEWNLFDYSINPNNDSWTWDDGDEAVLDLTQITSKTWIYSGMMKEGRWYPRAVELMDGRLVVVSGITNYNYLTYPSEISPWFEFFDYDAFLVNNSDGWRGVNSKEKENSPLNTPLEYFPSNDWVRWVCNFSENTNPMGCSGSVTVNTSYFEGSFEHTCEALKNDSIRLYPHMFLLSGIDDRVLITGGGAIWWVGNCTYGSSGAPRQTRNSYIFNIEGTRDNPDIRFEQGPKHSQNVTYYSTATWDPNNSSRIINFAGQKIYTKGGAVPGFVSVGDAGVGSDGGQDILTKATHWGGSGRGTRQMEIYTLPRSINDIGEWNEPNEEFLGPTFEFDRLMHFATLLPTKEILIIGGTHYKYYGGVKSPLLLKPKKDSNGNFNGEYSRHFMAPCRWSRAYHSVALLMPDGRVFTAGGNQNPATLYWNESVSSENGSYTTKYENRQPKPNLKRADTFGYIRSDGTYAQLAGETPGELYIAEIFSPPYMFIDEEQGRGQPEIIDYIWNDVTNFVLYYEEEFEGQNYYLMHSLSNFTLILNGSTLPNDTQCDIYDSSVVLIKLGSSSHGWDAGQRLFDLPIDYAGIIENDDDSDDDQFIQFTSPNATQYGIVPAFYMLFFVDCTEKPSVSLMVRFDNDATNPLWHG